MADVSLNGLKVKTDSLPNDWYVSLINPKDGEPAEIMTVAKFVELLTPKQPEATDTTKGLMSAYDQANLFKYRGMLSDDFTFNDAIEPGMYQVASNVAGLPENAYRYGYLIVFKTGNNPTQIYIPDTSNSNYIYVRQWWLSTLPNLKWKAITTSSISAINNLYSKTANCLTETVPTSPVPESRQVRSTCLQNHLYQILLPTCLDRKGQMVQHQLKVNQTRCRSSTFGLSTKLERQYLNCRKKINILNKSSRLTA